MTVLLYIQEPWTLKTDVSKLTAGRLYQTKKPTEEDRWAGNWFLLIMF